MHTEDLKNTKKKLREKWPLAYADPINDIYIDLESHLDKTAELIKYVFSDRLKYLSRVSHEQLNFNISIDDLAYLAGLLHDLGKASPYYIEKYSGGVLSFYLHEYIGALLLLDVAYREMDREIYQRVENEKNTYAYYILARVIARHHVANSERTPLRMLQKQHNDLMRAFAYICEDAIHILLDRLGNRCYSSFCKNVIKHMKEDLEEKCKRKGKYLDIDFITHIKALAGFDLAGYNEDHVIDSYKITVTLSGLLIVADNLTASFCENRSSDEKATPLYVNHWKGEIYHKLHDLKSNKLLGICNW